MNFKLFIVTVSWSLIFSTTVQAQFEQHTNHWYFGHGAGLDFSTGTAVSVSGSTMIAREGSTSYSDENGNLLFYSNGVGVLSDTGAVWNRNHQIMPNGLLTDISGYSTTMQTSIVVPKPGSPNQYYLFSLDGYENYYTGDYKGLTYSIVDMTLDGGLGDLTLKGVPMNVPAFPFLGEQITATPHSNGTDYWLIVHESNHINENSNEFFVYHISASGIVGLSSQLIGNPVSPGMQSTMQISAEGNRLAFNGEVFDFDNATGIISNPIEFASWGYMEFSRSGRFIYKSITNGGVYQYDLESPGIPAIVIASGSGSEYAQLQMGPDGKIYVSMGFYSGGFHPYLSVINEPELAGAACSFVANQLMLESGVCDDGLPNFIDYFPIDHTGIAEEDAESNFTLYPVPAFEVLNIQFTHKHEMKNNTAYIRNSLGQQVLEKQLQEFGNSIDIHALEAGMYFIRIDACEKKFIVK